jgi:hypothetical protein
MPEPPPARSIVYRHACDCATANQPPGDHPEHRFDVDGKPFPWLIDEAGATFRHHAAGDMYECRVSIIPILASDHGCPMTFEHHYAPANNYPVIAGLRFPWTVTAAGIMYRCSVHAGPRVELAFYAEHVDTDGPIEEIRGA